METADKIDSIRKWLGTGSINIFGLPFSGKDTHGSILAALFDAPVLGGGEILRNSNVPASVRVLMDNGELIPTKDYVRIVLPYLSSNDFKHKPLILSSVGRWHGEESGVIDAANVSGHPVKAVIFLHISIQTANRRFEMSQQIGDRTRADDQKDKLITRFSEFSEKTLPVIEYYRSKGMLIEVDGNPPIQDVQAVILDDLYKLSLAD